MLTSFSSANFPLISKGGSEHKASKTQAFDGRFFYSHLKQWIKQSSWKIAVWTTEYNFLYLI